ncbi:UpxY family transcription antiterminator [Phocaeicola sartorii]|uniref:UpxY family transcription antiterminator n=1 Tax=Phocaeicola sartorii TaxID=671267 RepID=UPI00242D3EE7|nr:UpxY family transcription antiterminator [Phocaeicola sartorii]
MSSSEQMQWFAMRATYCRGMQIKSLLDKQGINNFIPMRYEIREKNGRKKRELVPVIRDLIFVRAVQSELQRVKDRNPYLQYMIDIRNGQKIIVPDEQMRQFIAVVGTYDEHLVFFNPDEVNLRKGTKVRIIGGDFEGYEGVFIKVKGARDRRVVISLQGIIAMAMATISPDLIEVIK